jgi:hypothetical protein
MARRIRAGAEVLPPAERQKIVQMLDVRVQAVTRESVRISCLLPLAQAQEGAQAPEDAAEKNQAFPLSCTLSVKAGNNH